jgi:hypothetical protein
MSWGTPEETWGLFPWGQDYSNNNLAISRKPAPFSGAGGSVFVIDRIRAIFTLSGQDEPNNTFRIVRPHAEFELAGRTIPTGSFAITRPFPVFTLEGASGTSGSFELIGRRQVYDFYTRGFKIVVVNTDNSGVSEYTNFDFTSAAVYQDKVFLASSSGLYVLEGTTDDGTDITASFKTPADDFDQVALKTVTDAMLGLDGGPVDIMTYQGTTENTAHTLSKTNEVQTRRASLARGRRERYWGFKVSGTEAFKVDSLEALVDFLKRRING